MDFSLQRLLWLWSTGFRCTGSVVVAWGFQRAQASVAIHTGLDALQHMECSQTRDRTLVSCTGRRYHQGSPEVGFFILQPKLHILGVWMQKQIKAYSCLILSWTLKKGAGDSEDKESACNAGDAGLIPGSGRSPGEGNGNPLQYSCLENSIN